MTDEILRYLIDHPEAQDTLEGIAHWWVLERCIERRVAEVEEAVAELVARGFLVEHGGANGRVRYRLDRDRLAEIEELLRRQEDTEP